MSLIDLRFAKKYLIDPRGNEFIYAQGFELERGFFSIGLMVAIELGNL
jgi:hypothetical protein